jgi:hypothetical protein
LWQNARGAHSPSGIGEPAQTEMASTLADLHLGEGRFDDQLQTIAVGPIHSITPRQVLGRLVDHRGELPAVDRSLGNVGGEGHLGLLVEERLKHHDRKEVLVAADFQDSVPAGHPGELLTHPPSRRSF